MRLFLTILLTLLTLSWGNRIEDLAYDAYKAKDYKTALKLYQQEARRDSLKSFLMIGIFLEKGLGVEQSKEKAIKVYKLILKKVKNIRTDKDNLKDLDIAALAAKRLYALTKKDAYLKLAAKLKGIKDKYMAKNSSQKLNLNIKNYLLKCPAANVVKKEYQEGIDKIDCALFKEFPERMAQFMKLKSDRALAIKENREADLYEINTKIIKTLKPVLKYIEKETIECYSNANFLSEIKSCDYNYFVKTDPLLFYNRADKMKDLIAESKSKDGRLDKYQKDKLINSLIYQFSTQDYEKEAYRMANIY